MLTATHKRRSLSLIIMKNIPRILACVTMLAANFILGAAIHAQSDNESWQRQESWIEKERQRLNYSQDKAQAQQVFYQPKVVNLEGTIVQHTFPGPPNYTSVRQGDRPERCWLLILRHPVDVAGEKQDSVNDPEKNVTGLQLIIEDYKKWGTLVGKQVSATGTLSHSMTGHHHTRVLMDVQDLRPVISK